MSKLKCLNGCSYEENMTLSFTRVFIQIISFFFLSLFLFLSINFKFISIHKMNTFRWIFCFLSFLDHLLAEKVVTRYRFVLGKKLQIKPIDLLTRGIIFYIILVREQRNSKTFSIKLGNFFIWNDITYILVVLLNPFLPRFSTPQ